jgi:RNA polymerase sigma-70 factor (ECF subfamily)
MTNDGKECAGLAPEFVHALTDAQLDLYAFICMLQGNRDAAQDILQNTNLMLMKHAAEYDAARPFLPWAKAFAYNRVRTWLKDEARSRLVFDEDLMSALAEETPCAPSESRSELEALDACMEKLTPAQKALIQARYYRNESVGHLAERLRRTALSVYVQLHRIRRLLGVCIEERLGLAGAAAGEGA